VHDHIEISRILIQNGAQVNATCNSGLAPLHYAAIKGHVDILHLLVENGSDLDMQADRGMRTLHFAAVKGQLPIVQELVCKFHVQINDRVLDGSTALWLAKLNNHPETAAFLEANAGYSIGGNKIFSPFL
jgi:ankyrin repeat protein